MALRLPNGLLWTLAADPPWCLRLQYRKATAEVSIGTGGYRVKSRLGIVVIVRVDLVVLAD